MLARIITDVADGCLELTMQLRARGYQVEIVSPWQIPSVPADLEVRLDECDPEDVVAQAAQGASAGDLWVYVAPGALDPAAHPIHTIPLSPGLGGGMSPLPTVLPAISPPTINTPPIIGALAVDSREAEPILAELHAFPTQERVTPPEELPSSILIEIPDVAPHSAEKEGKAGRLELVEESGVPSQTGMPTSPIKGNARQETPVVSWALPIQDEQSSRTSTEKKIASSEPVPAKWLIDPAKVASVTPLPFTIPVVPEPVRANIPAPIENIRRTVARQVKWNFQPLQVACGLCVLAFLAWALILTGRPEATASSVSTGAALPTSKHVPVPQAVVEPSVEPTPQKSSAVRAQKSPPAVATVPSTPKEVTSIGNKSMKTRSHDEGLIAEDTVVFYNHKPSPPRAKAQPESTVKRYTDQN